ncbi:hypothetical protein HID58_050229 [Brassica napus]|uniref:Syntaxin-5 N-terminal Sly1p-binding domain-containing protein n=1 Tax=Brassica napus TaxID=3708 RepID=A0ABQ8A6V5_BRANA|nr:hypothetical protein HID58_050229 [Brassica napus]
MGSTFRDRTAEFHSLSQTLKKIGAAIPSVHQAESDPTSSKRSSPPGSSRSEFNKKASQIGLRIHETSQKTARLSKCTFHCLGMNETCNDSRDIVVIAVETVDKSQLAKESSIFNDRTLEIQELTVLIRNDITGLNMALSDLQTLQNMEIADGSYSHDKVGHYTAVCDDLKTRLMGATKQFQDVLTARSEVGFVDLSTSYFICIQCSKNR